ncbi:MAG: hypothetical protein Q9163_000835 [Psora crenata]
MLINAVPPVNRRPRHQPTAPSLIEFVANKDDSQLSKRLAGESKLPYSGEHQSPYYLGQDPSDIGTSRCVGGTNISSNPSLPCFTDSSSCTTGCSVASSSGCRALDRSARMIALDRTGALATFPLLRRPNVPSLECPFDQLHCTMEYQMGHVDEWITHSLNHFVTVGPHPRKIDPPPSNQCPLCEATFYDQYGVTSWKRRMKHVADHHKLGHTLSHARPDFALYEYLWQQKVIGPEVYRDIKGNSEDRSRRVHGEPSPPISRTGSMEEEESPETCAFINENGRRNRSRKGRRA